MAKSFLPDPLEMLRRAVNRLEGGANSLAGRGLEIEQVLKTLQQVSTLSLSLRQALELAMENTYRRLNLPSSREFADMQATLQRVEKKLDMLLAAQTAPPAAPKRARKPAAAKAAPAKAKAVAPADAGSPSRRRVAP